MAYQAKTVISIHAPVKGATRVNSLFKELGFQISIHAPVKGATMPRTKATSPYRDFNPRTREGCDNCIGANLYIDGVFQSTHP